MSRSIDNSENILDSRDIQKAAEALKDERNDLKTALEDATEALNSLEAQDELDEQAVENAKEAQEEAIKALEEFDADTDKQALLAFNEEGEGEVGEWHHGETVIRGDYFTDYCRELVSDIGDMPKEIPDYIVIDWEATAENIKPDYVTIDFGGVDYYVRSC